MSEKSSKDPLLAEYSSQYKGALYRLIEENIKKESGPSFILDIGCGKGDDIQRVSLIDKDRIVCGIDVSSENLRIASEQLKDKGGIYVMQAKAQALPFKKGSFDIVVSSEVIEHIEDASDLIREAHRVLKPLGAFIITTPSRFNYVSLVGNIVPLSLKKYLRKLVYYDRPGKDENPHIREYTPGEMKDLFRNNGFIVEKVEGGALKIPFWRLFGRFPFLITIWKGVDRIVGMLPFGVHLKLNFIMAGRKAPVKE